MATGIRYTPELIQEYVGKGYWTATTLSEAWERTAAKYPDREAIADSQTRLTWSQANERIDRYALGFAEMGIKRDEVIVMQLPPSVDLLLLRVACEKAGILGIVAARTLRQREMEYIINLSQPVALVIPCEFGGFNYYAMLEEMRPHLPPIKYCFIDGDRAPEGTVLLADIRKQPWEEKCGPDYLKTRSFPATETSLIVHTTGTTGMPKLVEHAACSRLWQGRDWMARLNLTAADTLGMFLPAPAGPNTPVYYGSPQSGARVVILEKFTPEAALELIQQEKITFGVFVPTMLQLMTAHPDFEKYDLGSLRFVQTAGAPLPYQAGVEVEKKLQCPIYQVYGGIDHDPCTMHSLGDSFAVRHQTVGKPISGSEFRILDDEGQEVAKGQVGEVWGRGAACPPGFYKDDKGTLAVWKTGYINTEDLGRWDEEGNLVLAGRKRDMIIRGGQNIYPSEVEELLQAHPRLLDAAVVKMPDPIMGEKGCAYLVLRAGEKISFAEMIAFLKEKKLAPYKLPERIEFIDKIPRIEGQLKVDKKVLEKDIADKLKSEGSG